MIKWYTTVTWQYGSNMRSISEVHTLYKHILCDMTYLIAL